MDDPTWLPQIRDHRLASPRFASLMVHRDMPSTTLIIIITLSSGMLPSVDPLSIIPTTINDALTHSC